MKKFNEDQDWNSETTTYWFDAEGEIYGVVDHNGDLSVVDCDGCPTDRYTADQFVINN